MKKIWRVLGVAALVAGLIPYKAEENLETGEKTYDALLWQVRTCRDAETGKSALTAVSILPTRRIRHGEADLFDDDALCPCDYIDVEAAPVEEPINEEEHFDPDF